MDWHVMAFLGAYHGINPGMGWLFAVALGLQQGSARGVWRALPPIVAGHAAAVAMVLLVAGAAQLIVPFDVLRFVVASVLIALGLYRLRRHGHPRFGGMQVGLRDLAVWSFLMASAHGAGLMLVPLLIGGGAVEAAVPDGLSHHASALAGPLLGLMATTVHMVGYLGVTSLVAWTVYHKVGLRILRSAWFNIDLIWAGALVVAGLLTFSL